MKNKIYLFFVFGLIVLFFSCQSLPVDDGTVRYYSYDYELMFNFSEYNLMMQQNLDYSMSQDYTKKTTGSVVLMQNNTFVEPDFGYRLVIVPNGIIYSPDNPSVTGKYKPNGEFYWRGVNEASGFFRNILVTGKLNLSTEQDRADSSFNGSFILTDPGTGREQQVLIQDGIYFWQYAQKEDADFEPWPIIIEKDGSFATSLEMITRSCLTFSGMEEPLTQETIYSTEQHSQGQVQPGSLSVQTVTKTLGQGLSGNRQQDFTYVGTVASMEQQEQLQNKMNQVFMTGNKELDRSQQSTPPLWYVVDINLDQDYLLGRGSKKHSDKAEALKLAQVAAVADLVSAISLEVKSQSYGKETKEEKKLYQIVETVSNQKIEYEVVNSFYDEEFSTAYVMVKAL